MSLDTESNLEQSITILHMKPLVTLAITTLNRPLYLKETLACVLAQDYDNLDVLISDNGSSDETPQLARSIVGPDLRFRFRRNATTVPVHEHFTQCVEAARGEYFILLSDDDRINPCFVSELVAVAIRYPDVNVVVPSNVMIDQRGRVTREFAKPSGEVFEGPPFVCNNWLQCTGPQLVADVATVLLRTETVRNFGGYQAFDGGRNVDNLLFLQCALTSRVGFAHRAEFSWRCYSQSYGFRATPEQIGESGRKFVRHLRCDTNTVAALGRVSAPYRKRISRAVGEVTTLEVLSSMTQHPFDFRMLRRLLAMRHDSMFVYVTLREYLRIAFPTIHHCLRALRRGALFLFRTNRTGVPSNDAR